MATCKDCGKEGMPNWDPPICASCQEKRQAKNRVDEGFANLERDLPDLLAEYGATIPDDPDA